MDQVQIDITLPKLHIAQRQANTDARFSMFRCGRRFGKDVLMQYRAIKRVQMRQPQGWFAPTYRQMTENYKAIYNMLAPIVTAANKSEFRIEVLGGGLIEFWSLENYNAARGRKYKHVTINEAAMSANLMDAWNYVIRPTLADMRGGADFGSTPKGLNGFYELWAGADGNPDWSLWHYTTYDNPHIPADEIDAMRMSMPERVFSQEILAEFVEDGAYFQNVNNCAVVEHPDRPEDHPGHTFAMATDFAKTTDFHVSGIACRECKKVVDWIRSNNLDYIYQREQMRSLYNRWYPALVVPERNSMGEPNVEIMLQDNWPIILGSDGKFGFYTSPTTKPPLIEALAQAFILYYFQVPVEARHELSIYEVIQMMSGYSKFGAPSGQHDDWVMMLALLWHGMNSFSGHLPEAQPTQTSKWRDQSNIDNNGGSRWRRY